MIGRNPYVALFELEVLAGRRRADLAAAVELFKPLRDVMARLVVDLRPFVDEVARVGRVLEAAQRGRRRRR